MDGNQDSPQATKSSYTKPHSSLDLWVQLLGTASTSNIEIAERFQPKGLRMIVDAFWYVLNTVTRRDLQTNTNS
jgi:hypothetical protein